MEKLLQEILTELKEINKKIASPKPKNAKPSKYLTLEEFGQTIGVSYRLAHGMANCEEFKRHKISLDISRKGRDRKKALWRIDIDKYYSALEKGLL